MSRSASSLLAVAKKRSLGGPSSVGVPTGDSVGGPSTVGGLAVNDVSVGAGRVEDGTASSVIARFLCSVPGCGASFTHSKTLLWHQTHKHGAANPTYRTLSTVPAGESVGGDDYVVPVKMTAKKTKLRKKFACSDCQREFKSRLKCTSHMSVVHQKKSAGKEPSLSAVAVTVHKTECRMCKTVHKKCNLTKHMRLAHQMTPEGNPINSETLTNEPNVSSLQTREPKSFTSEVESTTSASKTAAEADESARCTKSKAHIKKAYKCSDCPKAFTRSGNLYRHMASTHRKTAKGNPIDSETLAKLTLSRRQRRILKQLKQLNVSSHPTEQLQPSVCETATEANEPARCEIQDTPVTL